MRVRKRDREKREWEEKERKTEERGGLKGERVNEGDKNERDKERKRQRMRIMGWERKYKR